MVVFITFHPKIVVNVIYDSLGKNLKNEKASTSIKLELKIIQVHLSNENHRVDWNNAETL